MRRYLRSRTGSTFFFTVVTHERRAILTSDLGRRCLRTAMTEVRKKHSFQNVAMVLLPDHLHAVWELPHGDANYSTRWRLIKRRFTQLWCELAGSEGVVNASRQAKGERGIWQRRF
ncbi:MAG: transposase [Planctomycetaceae bacterium]